MMEPQTRAIHTKFVERPDLTKLMESHFFPQLDGEKTFPTVSSFLLYGMAGSGKSQLAHSFFIKYAEKCVDLRFSQAVANVLEVQSHVLGQC